MSPRDPGIPRASAHVHPRGGIRAPTTRRCPHRRSRVQLLGLLGDPRSLPVPTPLLAARRSRVSSRSGSGESNHPTYAPPVRARSGAVIGPALRPHRRRPEKSPGGDSPRGLSTAAPTGPPEGPRAAHTSRTLLLPVVAGSVSRGPAPDGGPGDGSWGRVPVRPNAVDHLFCSQSPRPPSWPGLSGSRRTTFASGGHRSGPSTRERAPTGPCLSPLSPAPPQSRRR